MIRSVLGVGAEEAGAIAILIYNIVSMIVILVICSQLILPNGSWLGQTALTVGLLAAMTGFALMGIDVDKTIVSTSTWGLIGVLLVACGFSMWTGPVTLPTMIPAKSFVRSMWMFFFVLIGFDSLMKFAQEAKDPSDIPTSFYLSNAISIGLTGGVAAAVATWVRLTPGTEYMALESLFAVFAGSWTRGPFTALMIAFLLLATFVVFLSTTRYLFGLGEKGGVLASFAAVTEEKVPWAAILSIFGAGAGVATINHVDTLVMVTDYGFSIIGGLVAAATCVADWRDGLVGSALIDGGVATGFVAMMMTALV